MDGLKLLTQLNLNHLKIFLVVFRSGSMTGAAQELHLTQSGVSQHIKALEEDLGVQLFDRLHRRLVPTQAAHQLKQNLEPVISRLIHVFEDISAKEPEISGVLRVGLPVEFGVYRIFPLLAQLGQKYEKLRFEISLDYASKFNRLLLNNQLDFAIIDNYELDPMIDTLTVAKEELYLCADSAYLKSKGPFVWEKNYFENLDYIAYQQGEPVLRQWFQFHFKRKKINFNVKAQVMDVRGVARLIGHGLGAGVLPNHTLKNIKSYFPNIKIIGPLKKPLVNKIHLAYLKGLSPSKTRETIFEAIIDHLDPKLNSKLH